MTNALAVMLAALSAAAAAPVPRFAGMREDQIAAELVEIHKANPELGHRIDAVSERFLGTPYALGPLGEGEQGEYDRDPLIDFTKVDCTTFIEEVMALSLESELPKAKETLRRIRYAEGQVGYETRNHFPETDWIPNNVKAGFIEDVTRRVAGRRTKWVFKTISKSEWYEAKSTADLQGFASEPPDKLEERAARLRKVGERIRAQNVRLAYVPLDALPSVLARIPNGAIANVVREDRRDKPIVVTHQVLIIQRPEGAVVRHAAQDKQVEDVPALEYFQRLASSKWRVLGLNLNAVGRSPNPPL